MNSRYFQRQKTRRHRTSGKSAVIRILHVSCVSVRLPRLQIPILAHGIEAWTGFARVQIPVPDDKGLGVSPVQIFEQATQGSPLRFSPRVRRHAVRRQTADVAHPYGMPVMTLAMRPGHFIRPARFDGAICRNDIMITTAQPAAQAMTAVNIRHPQGTARPVGGAVHDNQRDGSHRWVPSAPPAAPLMSNSMNLTT